MTEGDSGSNVRHTTEAVKGIVEAVPVYEDLAQPAAQELGRGLLTIAKTVNVLLAPLKVVVWGYEQFEDFLSSTLPEKLSNTPEEELITPKAYIAGPTLEALRYTGFEEDLRELYANLLAASMDARTASLAHPGFVEIIKQITPDEARLLKYFSSEERLPLITVRGTFEDGTGYSEFLTNFSLFGTEANCEHVHLTPAYLNNLSRLGIVDIEEKFYVDSSAYEALENHPSVVEFKKQIDDLNEPKRKPEIEKKVVTITQLGAQFLKACVIDHRNIFSFQNQDTT